MHNNLIFVITILLHSGQKIYYESCQKAKRTGDVKNEIDVLGEYSLQFAKYHGQSFRWMLENALD